jgi:hypothetical protein
MLVEAAHQACSRHREQIEKSKLCACFYCRKTFSPTQIDEWIDEPNGGQTALCPFCGIDSVLGDASGYKFTHEFLAAMQKRWFGT